MRKAMALAIAAALLGSACSGGDSQSVSADGAPSEALTAQVVDDQVGATNGAPANANPDGLEGSNSLEAQERSNDGGLTQGQLESGQLDDGTSPSSTDELQQAAPSSTIPALGVPLAPGGNGIVIAPDSADLEDVSITEVECFIEDFGELTDVDLLTGIGGNIDLGNPQLAEAITLQSGFYPGQVLLAADSCLSPEARYQVAKNTPLLANYNQAQLDCMWPSLQVIGEALADGLSFEVLISPESPPRMQQQLASLVACI